jgi:hypothetical protein
VQQNLWEDRQVSYEARGVDGAKFSAKGGSFDYQDGELEGCNTVMYSQT